MQARNSLSLAVSHKNGTRAYPSVPQISSQQESTWGNRRPREIVTAAPPDSRPSSTAQSGSAAGRSAVFGPAALPVSQLNSCPQKPSGLVELVHAHIDRDPAAVGPVPLGRQVVIPLHATELVDLAQLSLPDPPVQLAQLGDEAAPVSNLQQDPSLRGRACCRLCLLGADPSGLLAQHRNARRGEPRDQIPVLV
jgi:hypothetical protein